ncbi:selenocysteine-specific translation elongation factor [candidate division KSB1 bacterium]|nr:selenocysteine-specific translation elongation factor [candidate division KSB1 bacterium]
MSHIIIGTAGHIDHGKTALVKALTGVDTDRLKEEKERGLTIDLGFAHFGKSATIIDVPGHEKFIRNMVAGVSTIELVLLVVAADDGVMPQTREHLDILKILQVKQGIIVITKKDLVDDDWLGLVHDDVRSLIKGSFLENARMIAVSAINGEGIPEVKAELENLYAEKKSKKDGGIFWMPVDRTFTMRGFGTVVTGSVLSGQLKVGESLELLPQKQKVKVRGLQRHGQAVEKVSAGDRAAVNLQAIEKQQIHRGDVLGAPNYFSPSERFDARLQLLKSAPRALKPRSRVRVHFGTTEVMARLSLIKVSKIDPGESAFVQFHLEQPATARRLDPFVIRQYSPTITIGGGVILDANAPRHKLSDPSVLQKLQALEKENPAEVLESKLLSARYDLLTLDQLSAEIAASKEAIKALLNELENQEKVVLLKKAGQEAVIHCNNFEEVKNIIVKAVADFHKNNPAKFGIHKAEFKSLIKVKMDSELLDFLLQDLHKSNQIKESSGIISLKTHKIEYSPEQESLRHQIVELLFNEGFSTSSETEMAEKLKANQKNIRDVLSLMIGLGEVIRADGNIYFHPKRVQDVKEKLASYFEMNKEITIGQFKDLLGGASRKYALPLLLYFDGLGFTERSGDVRVFGNR